MKGDKQNGLSVSPFYGSRMYIPFGKDYEEALTLILDMDLEYLIDNATIIIHSPNFGRHSNTDFRIATATERWIQVQLGEIILSVLWSGEGKVLTGAEDEKLTTLIPKEPFYEYLRVSGL